ncbi:MAG: hypothetical protein HQL30_11940, partial [Candidatus Omnitrophica bacterium]|nr:hypothetical protein [Candidatus Omnitrophota bacterium]
TDGSGALSWDTPTAAAAGLDTEVQFNDGGAALGNDAQFTYSKVSDALTVSGMTFDAGSLTDATGAISFGNENLSTTGTFSAEDVASTDDADINDQLTAGNIIIDEAAGTLDFTGAGSAAITSSGSGSISFGDDNITTTGNATALDGTFTGGDLTIGAGATAYAGKIVLNDADGGDAFTTTIASNSDVGASFILTLPQDDGGANEFLKTDGSGVLSWSAVITSPAGADTQVLYNNGGVFGGAAAILYDDTDGSTQFKNATDSATGFQVMDADAGTPVLNVDTTSELVGIGTAAPEGLLEVQGAEATDAKIYLDADDGDDNADTWIIASQQSDNDFTLTNHVSELLRVQDGGSVGIGTTAPDRALEVNHATGSNLRLSYNAPGGTAANYADFLLSASGDLTITPSGNDIFLHSDSAKLNFGAGDDASVIFDGDSLNISANAVTATDDIILTADEVDVAANHLEVPSGAAPTVDEEGHLAVDTTADDLIYYGAAKRSLPYEMFKSITIEYPANGDNFLIFKAPYPLTVTAINAIVDPADAGESVDITLQERNSTGGGAAPIEAVFGADNDGASVTGAGIDDNSVAEGGWVSLNIGAVTGTVTQVVVTITYVKTAE